MNGFLNEEDLADYAACHDVSEIELSGSYSISRKAARRYFVTNDEYCQLITSRRRLDRDDQIGGDIRGVCDKSGGVIYSIETKDLGVWR
jgi:hypothetical protein